MSIDITLKNYNEFIYKCILLFIDNNVICDNVARLRNIQSLN